MSFTKGSNNQIGQAALQTCAYDKPCNDNRTVADSTFKRRRGGMEEWNGMGSYRRAVEFIAAKLFCRSYNISGYQ